MIVDGEKDPPLGVFYIVLFLSITGFIIWFLGLTFLQWLTIIFVFWLSFRWFLIGLCYTFGIRIEE